MSNNGYIKGVGDSDYNFGYNDFTVEFFTTPTSNISPQTIFEITNNESPAANLYIKNRFLTTIENGNINAYGLQTKWPLILSGGSNSFSISETNAANIKLFYDGGLLEANQYNFSNGNITLHNTVIVPGNVLVEVGEILFSVMGESLSLNTPHFISAERKNENFYLYLDGNAQSQPVNANVSIPSQYITNSANIAQVLSRVNSSALLTIGANKDGCNPFIGNFGDFRITNGIARHVSDSYPQNSISSQFIDSSLGIRSSDINICGGGFVDNFSSHSTEEKLSTQLFDTLNISVYQNSNCANLSSNISNVTAISSNVANPNFNANNTVLGFRIFKNTITNGPIGTYNFNSGNSTFYSAKVPWPNTITGDSASVTSNGNVITSNSWSIAGGQVYANVSTNSNIKISLTGQTSYYSIGNTAVSTLVSNVYANSSIITIANVAGFITPNANINSRGVVFINSERITYLYINRSGNSISGLMRGTLGTGVPTVHTANTQIISASSDRIIPYNAWEYTWYNTANSNLAATNSNISNFLVAQGTTPPR